MSSISLKSSGCNFHPQIDAMASSCSGLRAPHKAAAASSQDRPSWRVTTLYNALCCSKLLDVS